MTKKIIGRVDPADRQVTIWGGGFSGLIIGYYLKANGYKVTIHEKSNRVGGKIQTLKTSSGLVERGANALYLNPEAVELLKELKLQPISASPKLRRLLFINGKPRNPFQLLVLLSALSKSFKKPPLVTEGLTVADFFKPLIGEEAIKNFISPALGGLYATTADQLHFKSLFPQFEKMSQFDSYWAFFKLLIKHQKEKPKMEISGSVSFDGGMQALINHLAEALRKEIKINSKESFKVKGNTIICTDAQSAAELLKDERPQMSSELASIKYRSVTTTTVFMKRRIKSLDKAFGVLIPLDNGLHSIGVINNKAIFPANNENLESYTFIAPKQVSDKETMEDIKALGPDILDEDVVKIESTYYAKGLPIYDLKRHLAIKRLHQLAREEKHLAIFGNYVAGISLREMILAAKNFAKSVKDE